MIITNLLLMQLAFLVPILAALFAAIIPFRNVRDPQIILISCALPFLMFRIYQEWLVDAPSFVWKLFEIVPGLSIDFRIEALGLLFAILLAILWVISLIYAVGYMRGNNEGNLCRFYMFFNLSIFASLGIAFAANLFTLFIFYEMLTLVTYPLITHNRNDKTKKAGRKYLIILLGSSMLFFLPAMLITFNAAGTLDFTIDGILAGKVSSQMGMVLIVLYFLGIAKAALVPMHKWLPGAMVAPTPVSALLHAVAVVQAGVFTLTKVIVYIFGVDNLAKIMSAQGDYSDALIYFTSFTVIIASIVALAKDGMKLRLAYSTISQLAYVPLALVLFTPDGTIAAVVQIAAHSFAKATMFFCAGCISTSSHRKKISEMAGVGKRMPLTFALFSIATISMIGMPPTVGFISKWYILDAAMTMEQYVVVGVIGVSTLLNAAYFLPVIYRAYFEKPKLVTGIINKKYGEAPVLMLIAAFLSCIMILVLFAWPNVMLGLAQRVGK